MSTSLRGRSARQKFIASIVELHAEDAAFLWLLRDRSASAPHLTLAHLARLDDRVDAHLDGLRIAGPAGWEICKAILLAHKDPGDVFAAATLAFDSGDADRIRIFLELADWSPELSRPAVSALGWLPFEQIESILRDLVASESPTLRRIGIAACSAHRHDPGLALEQALSDDDLALRARALRAVGELGLTNLLPSLRAHFDAEDPECQFAAAWSSALLGETSAVRVLGGIAASGGPHATAACAVALRRLALSDALKAHRELDSYPELERLAVMAAGIIGDPALVEWLLDRLDNAPLARLAGEAFTSIAGADLEYEDLDGDPPREFAAGPTDDPNDDNVALDPDLNLPWPDPELVRNWWRRYRPEFRAGTRYLLGNQIAPDWSREVLRLGRQRQRAAAALELAVAFPGQPLFETRAPGFRQRAILRTR